MDEIRQLEQEVASLQAQMARVLTRLAALSAQHQNGGTPPATPVDFTQAQQHRSQDAQDPVTAITAPAVNTSARTSNALSSLHSTPPTSTAQLDSLVLPAPAAPPAAPMAATRVVMHQIVLPSEVDSLGICFGGQVLSWIDVCAGLSAKTLARGPCVTATLDAVHFLRPCRLGSVVIVAAMVNRTFNTSMEVGVKVESEDMKTGVRHHCCSAYLTFVMLPPKSTSASKAVLPPSTPPYTVTDTGLSRQASLTNTQQAPNTTQQVPTSSLVTAPPARPTLPRVIPTTPEHARVHEEAEERRKRRLAERQRLRSDPELAWQIEMCRLSPITHREGGPTLPPTITAPWLSSKSADQFAPQPNSTPTRGSGPQGPPALEPPGEPSADDSRSSSVSPSATRSSKQRQSAFFNAGTDTGCEQTQTDSSRLAVSSKQGTPVVVHPPPRVASTAWFQGLEAESSRHGGQSPRKSRGNGQRIAISPSLTVAYMTQSIMPQHANTLGITFGGQVMSWMEMCAYISASRLRSPHILTAAIDSLTFTRSTSVGNILYVTSQVTAIFGSSLEVQVSVHGEDPQVGELFHCADGYVTLVTVAAEEGPEGQPSGSPVHLPFVIAPSTPTEVLQAESAVRRRDERLKLRAALCAKYQPQETACSS